MEICLIPDWLLAKAGIAVDLRPHAAMLLSTLLVIAAVPALLALPHVCLAQWLLGIPCPGCGVLHSLTALVRLHFADSWRANPAGMALAGLLAFQLIARPAALFLPRTRRWICRLSRLYSVTVIALLLLVWIYRLVDGGLHGGGFLS